MVSVAPGGVRHAPSGTALPGTAAVSAAHSGGRALRLSAGMAEAEVRGKLGPVRKDGAQSQILGQYGCGGMAQKRPYRKNGRAKSLAVRRAWQNERKRANGFMKRTISKGFLEQVLWIFDSAGFLLLYPL